MVPMPKADTVVFSVRMPRELHARLLAVAQTDYSTVNRSIVVAVERYIRQMQARRPKADDGR
jgi:predicted DNA-binding protein